MVTHHPIKVWRFSEGVTLESLSRRVRAAKSYLSELERWKKTPSLKLARRIAKETGLSLDDVLRENPNAEGQQTGE